jgi:geranylgeranyl reductase family protein
MVSDADVIVAGGGPAGAAAARALAAAGLDTLLVDRAAFPRNKPCGGGISARALTRLPWLASSLSGVEVHRISRLRLEAPGDAALDVESRAPCVLLVRRVEFDHALVMAAEAAGARRADFDITQVESQPGAIVLKSRDGRRLRAPLVVAADGVHSVIAKRLGMNPRWPRTRLAIDMMEETPIERLAASRPDVLWVAYAYQGLDGYAYVFPKTRHVNVGIGCLLSHFDAHVTAAPYALQERFVSTMVDRGWLSGRSDRRSFTPFLIPVGGPLRRAWHGRVLFAGDAGGFVHAVTAEGIYYAMVTGELAAQAILATREAPEGAGRAYERLWRREIGAELADAVLIQQYLFASHARVGRVVNGAAVAPAMTAAILAYVRGELPYSTLRRRMLVRFPLTVFRMARERWRRRADDPLPAPREAMP